METRDTSSGFSGVHQRALSIPLLATASVCVAILLAVIFYGIVNASRQEYVSVPQSAITAQVGSGNIANISPVTESAAIATSDIAQVGPEIVGQLVQQYQQMKASGTYSPEAAGQAAQQLARAVSVLVPYKQYTVSNLHTSSDTSYAGMLAYRAALKQALAPMIGIKDLEIAVFAKYSANKNPVYLNQLNSIITTYNSSTAAAAAVQVPQDAVPYHLAILNAMGQFSSTLQALVDNANDPITTVTLLRSYNDAEGAMVSSFNSLALYYAHHKQS